jgi:putative endonuclease
MTQKSEIGQIGENLACEYLRDKGYKIIARNYRKPWGEIDIITKAPNKTLVFMEVKTLRQAQGKPHADINPEDNLTSAKLQKLQRTAQLYAGHYPGLIDDNKNWQIDLIAIFLDPRGDKPEIKHYENI